MTLIMATAKKWAAREIELYNGIIKATMIDTSLCKSDRESLLRFAAEEIGRLECITDAELCKAYRAHSLSVAMASKSALADI